MRQLTMTEDRRVEWQETPDPLLREANDAIVRPLAVALCDLDYPIVSGRAPIPGPIALGHEFVAEIVHAGDMTELEVGTRAVVPFQISCGECERCLRGQTGDCLTVPGALDVRLRPLRRRLGRRALRPRARAVRRPHARADPRRPGAGDGRERQRQRPRRLAHRRAPARAAPGRRRPHRRRRGAQHRPLRGRRRARSRRGQGDLPRHRRAAPARGRAAGRATCTRAPLPERLGSVRDHRRRGRHPREPPVRAALDGAGRRLHERRDHLRGGDAAAAARDVHERRALPHRARPGAAGDPRHPRARGSRDGFTPSSSRAASWTGTTPRGGPVSASASS